MLGDGEILFSSRTSQSHNRIVRRILGSYGTPRVFSSKDIYVSTVYEDLSVELENIFKYGKNLLYTKKELTEV